MVNDITASSAPEIAGDHLFMLTNWNAPNSRIFDVDLKLMQASTGSTRPVLLHYNTKAGHSGGLPVTRQIEDQTDELSFLFWQLGVMVK